MIAHHQPRREAQGPARGCLVYFVPSSGLGADRAPVYKTTDLGLCPGAWVRVRGVDQGGCGGQQRRVSVMLRVGGGILSESGHKPGSSLSLSEPQPHHTPRPNRQKPGPPWRRFSLSSVPGVQFHKLSPCAVPNPGLGSARDKVVTTTASWYSWGTGPSPSQARTQRGQERGSQGTPNPA